MPIAAAFWIAVLHGATGDTTADHVVGQAGPEGFRHTSANFVELHGFHSDAGVAVYVNGPAVQVYIADTANNRVLGSESGVSSHYIPIVIGQHDSLSIECNQGTGKASLTSLCEPTALAVDATGNLYVADRGNNRVLRFNHPFSSGFPEDLPASVVLGQPNFKTNQCNRGNGAPDASTLCDPAGVAVDASGNVWVADTGNSRVLGYQSPFVNGASASLIFGQGGDLGAQDCNHNGESAASLCHPLGVAVDPRDGDLYVADSGNNRALLYHDPAGGNASAAAVLGTCGSYSGFGCGEPNPTAATLLAPSGMVVDGAGNLYVADTGNSRVLEFNDPGSMGGAAAAEVFGQPNPASAACNTGSFAAGGTSFSGTSAGDLCNPAAVTLDANGTLYIADTGNNRVLTFAAPLSGTAPSGVIGQVGFSYLTPDYVDDGGYWGPFHLAIDKSVTPNRIYVADSGNNRILGYAPISRFLAHIGGAIVIGQPDTASNYPNYNGAVIKPNGAATAIRAPSARSLSFPTGLALDSAGNLYVADVNNNRVLEYDAPYLSGRTAALPAQRVFGQGGLFTAGGLAAQTCNQAKGQPSNATLCLNAAAAGRFSTDGSAVAVDSGGHLYVADTDNNRVLEYDNPLISQTADRVFGQAGDFTTAVCNQGGISADSLCHPRALAVDASDDLYVGDGARILEYRNPLAAGGGTPGVPGSPGDTTADLVLGQNGDFSADLCNQSPSASALPGAGTLCLVTGMAFDSAGDLYAADRGNNRLLEYLAPLTASSTAAKVFGQSDNFIANACNPPEGASADSLCNPAGLEIDPSDNLYVADRGNNRFLVYDNPNLPPPTPTATPTPVPVTLTVTPTKLSFPKQVFTDTGATSKQLSVQVSNTSRKLPVILEIASTVGSFTASRGCGRVIPPRTRCHVMVTFKPRSLGLQQGLLSLFDNARGSPQLVALSGRGVPPAMRINPAALNFGIQTVGLPAAPRQVKLINPNPIPVTIQSIVPGGPDGGEFAPSQNCAGQPLAAGGGTCIVTVVFTPASRGSHVGRLMIGDTSGAAPHSVALRGAGR